jgi:hypothetical protein
MVAPYVRSTAQVLWAAFEVTERTVARWFSFSRLGGSGSGAIFQNIPQRLAGARLIGRYPVNLAISTIALSEPLGAVEEADPL